jgi:hypothetical protein
MRQAAPLGTQRFGHHRGRESSPTLSFDFFRAQSDSQYHAVLLDAAEKMVWRLYILFAER